jgi:hypothetical protein
MDDDCGVRRLKPVLRCLDFLVDIILDDYRDTNEDAQREGRKRVEALDRMQTGRMEDKCKDWDDSQELV